MIKAHAREINSKYICIPFNGDTVDYDFVVSRLWSFHPYTNNLELDSEKRQVLGALAKDLKPSKSKEKSNDKPSDNSNDKIKGGGDDDSSDGGMGIANLFGGVGDDEDDERAMQRMWDQSKAFAGFAFGLEMIIIIIVIIIMYHNIIRIKKLFII